MSTDAYIDWEILSPILHPLYPGMEPTPPGRVSGINSIFGCRFGVLFLDIDGIMYGRPVLSAELLLCYSIPEYIFPDKSAWPRMDSILDSLLPGSLPFEMDNSIASSASILGRIYDVQLMGGDNTNHGARCYLQGKAPTTTFDYKSGCIQDNDIKVLLGSSAISKGRHYLIM